MRASRLMRTPALWAAGTALFLSGTSSHALVTTESEVHRPDCEDLQTLTDWPWAEGFVTVCPRGLNYDIVFDFAQLHDWWELDVQGAKPWTITATPAGQVWRLSGDNSLGSQALSSMRRTNRCVSRMSSPGRSLTGWCLPRLAGCSPQSSPTRASALPG